METPDHKLSPAGLVTKHSNIENGESACYLKQDSKISMYCLIHYDLKLYVFLNPSGRDSKNSDFDIASYIYERLETSLNAQKDQLKHNTDIEIAMGTIFDNIDMSLLKMNANCMCEVVISVLRGDKVSVINLGSCLSFISEGSDSAISLATVHDVNNTVAMDAMIKQGLNVQKFNEYTKNNNISCTRLLGGYDYKKQFIDNKSRSLIVSDCELLSPSYTLTGCTPPSTTPTPTTPTPTTPTPNTPTPCLLHRYLVHCSPAVRRHAAAIVNSSHEQDIIYYVNYIFRSFDNSKGLDLLARIKNVCNKIEHDFATIDNACLKHDSLGISMFARRLPKDVATNASFVKPSAEWGSHSLQPIVIPTHNEDIIINIGNFSLSTYDPMTLQDENNSDVYQLKHGRNKEMVASTSRNTSLRICRDKSPEITSKIDFSEYSDSIMNISNEKRNNLAKIFHKAK